MSKKLAIKKNDDALTTEIVVASFKDQAKPLFAKLKKIEITDQASLAKASDTVKALKEIKKMAVTKRTSITDAIQKGIDLVDDLFKPFEGKIDEAEKEVKADILAYHEKLDAEKEQLEKDFSKGKMKISAYASKSASLQVTSSGASKIKHVNKLFIEDESKIPRKFLVPDESAIVAEFKNGKSVPGCKYKKVRNVSI